MRVTGNADRKTHRLVVAVCFGLGGHRELDWGA